MSEPEISGLRVAPEPDRSRVRLSAEVENVGDPGPYMELSILDPEGQEVANMLVMGVTEEPTEVTLHLRPPAPADEERPYVLRARLFYGAEDADERTIARREGSFRFPGG